MKNRSKMILGLASMLGISAGVSAVSGFAWFTTQRTATISASNFVVGAAEGSLSITKHTAVSGDKADANISATASDYTVANNVCAVKPASGSLADVSSGDGENFFKATVVDSGKKDGENIIYAVDQVKKETGTTSSVNTSQMVYIQWSLDVTNDGDVAIDVYLSGTTATLFKKHTDATADYSAYYRLAIFADTNTQGTLSSSCVFLYTNASHKNFIQESDVTNHYATGESHKDCPLDGTGTLTSTNSLSSVETIHKTSDITGGAPATAAKNNQLLIKGLTGTKTLRFVVWCEGTATPESEISTNAVDMSFQLVGLTAVSQ